MSLNCIFLPVFFHIRLAVWSHPDQISQCTTCQRARGSAPKWTPGHIPSTNTRGVDILATGANTQLPSGTCPTTTAGARAMVLENKNAQRMVYRCIRSSIIPPERSRVVNLYANPTTPTVTFLHQYRNSNSDAGPATSTSSGDSLPARTHSHAHRPWIYSL